jgi:hypothetical protein
LGLPFTSWARDNNNELNGYDDAAYEYDSNGNTIGWTKAGQTVRFQSFDHVAIADQRFRYPILKRGKILGIFGKGFPDGLIYKVRHGAGCFHRL